MALRVSIKDRDLGWVEFFKRARELHASPQIGVGVPADTSKGGVVADGADLTVAEIAAILEFGTTPDEAGKQRIPARSFARATFDKERERLAGMGKQLMTRILMGEVTVQQALNIMGASLSDAMKKAITARIDPPNRPSTIARKGSDMPLVDTGRLLNAISWVILTGER